jgi:hypothetical protein
MKEKPKLYVVRKYIKASNAAAAIRKDKTTPVHDVWVEEGFKDKSLAEAIGFTVDIPVDEDDE